MVQQRDEVFQWIAAQSIKLFARLLPTRIAVLVDLLGHAGILIPSLANVREDRLCE